MGVLGEGRGVTRADARSVIKIGVGVRVGVGGESSEGGGLGGPEGRNTREGAGVGPGGRHVLELGLEGTGVGDHGAAARLVVHPGVDRGHPRPPPPATDQDSSAGAAGGFEVPIR